MLYHSSIKYSQLLYLYESNSFHGLRSDHSAHFLWSLHIHWILSLPAILCTGRSICCLCHRTTSLWRSTLRLYEKDMYLKMFVIVWRCVGVSALSWIGFTARCILQGKASLRIAFCWCIWPSRPHCLEILTRSFRPRRRMKRHLYLIFSRDGDYSSWECPYNVLAKATPSFYFRII